MPVTFLVGENGSGKSTLLEILELLESQYDGAYVLNSKPVKNLKL